MKKERTLLDRVEAYLTTTGAAPSRFGWVAASDPKFVFQLRNGREPRRALRERVEAFIAANPRGLPVAETGRQEQGAAA